MRVALTMVAAGTAVAGCAVISGPQTTTPGQAVQAAAERPVAGIFAMTVRATGRQNFILYLNSQPDYRDQRNLSVEVPAAIELELADRFGRAVPAYLDNRQIRIRGVARRVRIDFNANGRSTGKYYYQTCQTGGGGGPVGNRRTSEEID